MNWIDKNGFFLLSNDSAFGLGLRTTSDVTLFVLVVMHMETKQVIWTANRNSPVSMSDPFEFDKNGDVSLRKGRKVVWTTNTGGKGVSAMVLLDSGNLVVQGNDGTLIWQSFAHPSNTLISNQEFRQGMRLVSEPTNSGNFSYILEILSGDMMLSVGYSTPQPYWSMGKDTRRNINKNGGKVISASIDGNSWSLFDDNKALLWQFRISDPADANATWIAVLGSDGFIFFFNLHAKGSPESIKIPDDPCSIPKACDPYHLCSGTSCVCPSPLTLRSGSCGTGIDSPCSLGRESVSLVDAGTGLDYSAVNYVSPSSKTDMSGCKESCSNRCSCVAMLYDNSSRNCFLFDQIGSFQNSKQGPGLVVFVKMSSNGNGAAGDGGGKKSFPYVVIIAVATVLVILGLIFVAHRYYNKKKNMPGSPDDTSEEDNFLETLTGMPTRFTYDNLRTATDNFSVKLGHGGFGSVYRGTLPDGTQVAVKKLENIGQGKKEFRAEVGIIGSIHHVHLVRLKGFCAEGNYRLLAYEYMANGSLERWIFKRNTGDALVDWGTRFNIAIGTAKGLAYLHEDCDAKIVHCDIKPENVLLDDNFVAKVSDFGLAKLMTREQSHVFTTLRGTRGYLAPEWITNYAISEKSDVYSYGMLLLEIIGGRKNFDPGESSEKSYFPSYAFKMLDEGKLTDILDSRLTIEGEDERVYTAIKVALWCIQEDMHLRPSMTKVIQMLEGLSPVPNPPMSSPLGSRLYSGFFKSMTMSGDGTSTASASASAPSDCNSDAYLSSVRLSGPR
ncbi:G-type lectin S-receptor-like serine/threonine-protein kinase SD2-5 [Hibiscus syriacus]|uniref:Receptor-like serine/threonine-protein kinase n=1 Tax=Hibiscus syriacus TaxID=106335 RepID=A0A6A3C6Z8_HIBSY|nr:G-type lectin S-receptor-like serine/threonine-protein kinase SD2-5 [Hibiscus syriacus]KAE8724504.1 G-type lectin S-receptor-like serine/threonine-protein kinase SD2-5 [Hibiscus syriacus]